MHNLYPGHLEPYLARALRDMLKGELPRKSDCEAFSGDVQRCLRILQETLVNDGLEAMRVVFASLDEERRWLGNVAGQEPPADLADLPERRVRFVRDDEFENLPPREWLISGILPKEGVALVFGPPACGKSFMVMAWSLCISTGTPWLGREVQSGPVAYVAGEGAFGIGPRIKAWKTFHQFTGLSDVHWFKESLVLQDSNDFSELLTAFEHDFAQPPVLVVLDTLSRCSGGADENSNTDMAKIIAAADVLQQRFHCTVLIVHHAGKDGERGPRGASAIVGNSETVVSVALTMVGCHVTCYKQKDAAKFEPFSLQYQNVQYGPTAEETSVVLVHDTANSQPALRQSEEVMLRLLKEVEKPLTYGEWKQAGIEAGLKERTAKWAITELLRSEYVQKEKRHYSILEKEILAKLEE